MNTIITLLIPVLYLLVVGYVLICLGRLVKAVERIADKLDKTP